MAGGPPARRRARAARLPREPHRRRRPRQDPAGDPLLRRRATGRRSPRRRSRSSATRTSTRSPAASPTGSETGSRSCMPRTLSPEKRTRYSRHLLIPEIGEEGQLRLLDSKILLIGAGGLGSPASLYLAAAGIGTLGHRRRGHRRRDEPAAADRALARHARHAEGRLREARDRRRSTPTSTSSPTASA